MVTFRTLWSHLAERIGKHCLPINPAATSLQELLEEGSGHHDLAKRLIAAVYNAGNCKSLDALLPLFPVLDRLGAIRHDLQTRNCDVDQLRLIDDIGEELVELFRQQGQLPSASASANGCQIVSLPSRSDLRLPRTAG